MNNIKRGQKVWVSLRNQIIETTVKSVGYKYITVNDIDILFDSKTLRRVCSKHCFIITDLEKYVKEREQYYKEFINKIKTLKWESVDREDLDKIADILKKY